MKHKMFTPLVQQETRVGGGEANELVLTLKVYVRKSNRMILYAECREEFVDFLFTFLAIPLEFARELSVDKVTMGCVGNLCRSVKELSFEQGQSSKIRDRIRKKIGAFLKSLFANYGAGPGFEQSKEATSVFNCILPYYYNSCRTQLLDIVIQEMPEYECLVSRRSYNSSKLSKKVNKNVLAEGERIAKLIPMVSSSDSGNIRIVKQETNFIVSDDLVVTPMKSSSTISLLSKLQMNISDIEEQVISIGKAQV
ncbi:uncharacterized protein LOC110227077 [Arabidopsis lyrata subsp. lyrata]|uniref:uncharacterized protein LOC110227077 n=1 Tax=Arabidopsis lyrata subsp. lyrata TaxID=81972 RepID=UPI000A29D1E7|nr:uncharacterized protein LOC110227077 [Arabidopsis lyrata subsp. lyrata]|eukprot:XP_020875867.1 uncharacterized protein LOC110227077 [Arabidopsis lyrata subsp. lyrata]